MSIEYKIATANDRQKLIALDLVSSEGELARYSRNKEGLFDVEEYKKRGGSFWVAEDGSQIVGTIGVRMSDDGKMKVKALRVHPDYRNKGIARTLMNLVEDCCRKRGEKEIILGVNNESLPAITLYKSLGYVKYDEKVFVTGNIVTYFKKSLE